MVARRARFSPAPDREGNAGNLFQRGRGDLRDEGWRRVRLADWRDRRRRGKMSKQETETRQRQKTDAGTKMNRYLFVIARFQSELVRASPIWSRFPRERPDPKSPPISRQADKAKDAKPKAKAKPTRRQGKRPSKSPEQDLRRKRRGQEETAAAEERRRRRRRPRPKSVRP